MNEDLFIGMAFSIILAVIKNPAKKIALRKAFAKVYKNIGNAFAGDEEFQKLIQ